MKEGKFYVLHSHKGFVQKIHKTVKIEHNDSTNKIVLQFYGENKIWLPSARNGHRNPVAGLTEVTEEEATELIKKFK